MLLELARREKEAGIKPDEDLDIFMKVINSLIDLLACAVFRVCDIVAHSVSFFQSLALGGQETNLVVEYIMKVRARIPALLSRFSCTSFF